MLKYIAGNHLLSALKIAKINILKNKIPVLNYAVENNICKSKILEEYTNINSHIKKNNNIRLAIKLSLFNFDYNLINNIIKTYVDDNIKILVDAEDDDNYSKYDHMSDKLVKNYNYNDINIIKTYQMYRKDSLKNLDDNINFAIKNNLYFGAKLVRGAYWNADKDKGNLYTNKIDTDLNYNKGIISLLENNKNGINILATHNTESINLGYLFNQKYENNIFEFAHLLGMKEKKYNFLLQNNQNINVYIPYGPYKYMIPYLSRRLYENIDTLKYCL